MNYKLISILLFNCLLLNVFAETSLEEAIEKTKKTRVWYYPYPELAEIMKAEGRKSILIFSYGSLMDTKSANRTLSEASLATRRPAVAYGLKRSFDRDVPIELSKHWCYPNDSKARGMLNVQSTLSSKDWVNGVLIDVEMDDIPRVLSREEGYDLMPIVVREWDSVNQTTKPTILMAYTFRAPRGSVYTNRSLKPRPGYYELTRDAARQFGPLFFKMWFQTTYLGDGTTPISDWENQVLKKTSATQATCP